MFGITKKKLTQSKYKTGRIRKKTVYPVYSSIRLIFNPIRKAVVASTHACLNGSGLVFAIKR